MAHQNYPSYPTKGSWEGETEGARGNPWIRGWGSAYLMEHISCVLAAFYAALFLFFCRTKKNRCADQTQCKASCNGCAIHH